MADKRRKINNFRLLKCCYCTYIIVIFSVSKIVVDCYYIL